MHIRLYLLLTKWVATEGVREEIWSEQNAEMRGQCTSYSYTIITVLKTGLFINSQVMFPNVFLCYVPHINPLLPSY